MENDTKNPIRNGEKMENIPIRDEKGRIVTGVLNPNGRPKGSRDFYNDFREAISQLKDKTTGESLTEIHIIKTGLAKMLKGDARFEGLYKDLMDRVYGKPVSKTELTGLDGGAIIIATEEKQKIEEALDDVL